MNIQIFYPNKLVLFNISKSIVKLLTIIIKHLIVELIIHILSTKN